MVRLLHQVSDTTLLLRYEQNCLAVKYIYYEYCFVEGLLILSMNKTAMEDVRLSSSSPKKIWVKYGDGQPVKVVFMRKGERKETTLTPAARK